MQLIGTYPNSNGFRKREVYYDPASNQTLLFEVENSHNSWCLRKSTFTIGHGPTASKPASEIKAYYDLDNFRYEFTCLETTDNELCIEGYAGYCSDSKKYLGIDNRIEYTNYLLSALGYLHYQYPVFAKLYLAKSLADSNFLEYLSHPLLQENHRLLPSSQPAAFPIGHKLLAKIFTARQ